MLVYIFVGLVKPMENVLISHGALDELQAESININGCARKALLIPGSVASSRISQYYDYFSYYSKRLKLVVLSKQERVTQVSPPKVV